MTFDITHDIFMAITKFAMTEHGNRPVYDELEYLSYLMRQGDATASWLLPRILRAIAFAERHGISDSFFKTLVENDNDGIPFTLVEPVKALKYHPPLIELRVLGNKARYIVSRIRFSCARNRSFDSQFLIESEQVYSS